MYPPFFSRTILDKLRQKVWDCGRTAWYWKKELALKFFLTLIYIQRDMKNMQDLECDCRARLHREDDAAQTINRAALDYGAVKVRHWGDYRARRSEMAPGDRWRMWVFSSTGSFSSVSHTQAGKPSNINDFSMMSRVPDAEAAAGSTVRGNQQIQNKLRHEVFSEPNDVKPTTKQTGKKNIFLGQESSNISLKSRHPVIRPTIWKKTRRFHKSPQRHENSCYYLFILHFTLDACGASHYCLWEPRTGVWTKCHRSSDEVVMKLLNPHDIRKHVIGGTQEAEAGGAQCDTSIVFVLYFHLEEQKQRGDGWTIIHLFSFKN